MNNDKSKTRADLLLELESIQDLLLDDDIPLLQEVFDPPADELTPAPLAPNSAPRPSLAKATGENPFLPEHIRARLQGNNPPPSFRLEPSPNPRHSPPAPEPKTDSANTRAALINRVLEALQPQIRRELQQQLEQLDSNALKQLLDTNH